MATTAPRYSMDEFEERGDAIYDRAIRPRLSADDDGKFVAIDIETGDFEIDSDEHTALTRLYARQPDAQPWMRRVGYRAVHSFGGRLPRDE